MHKRLLVAIALSASTASGQAGVTPMTCEAILLPADRGSGNIGVVAEGPDGRLAWTDGRPGKVIVRDALGTLRIVGRSGDRPGEFAGINALGWKGDTLWTSDATIGRIQYFTDAGRLLSHATGTPAVTWYPRPDGRMVGLVIPDFTAPVARPVVLVKQQPGEQRRDTVAAIESAVMEHFPMPPSGRLTAQPFAPHTITGANADGSRFCSVRPYRATWLIECVDDRGRTVVSQTQSFRPSPLTAAVHDSVVQLMSHESGQSVDTIRALIKRPRSLPSVMEVMLDRDGTIWLERSHRLEASAVWTRVRVNGSLKGELVIAKPYRVIKPDGSTLWMGESGNDGRETLHRCQLSAG